MSQYWGYHLVIDASGCDHDAITSGDQIRAFCKELVRRIDMVAYGEPLVEHFATHDPEKAGYSLVQLIETSNICAHFVDKDNTMYLDVFSCKPFETEVVKQTVADFFGAQYQRMLFLTRQA